MKNILLIASVAVALAACGTTPQPTAPAVNITGEWVGTVSSSSSAPVIVYFTQTNTPNPGDFTGKFRGDPSNPPNSGAPLTGNVNTGRWVATEEGAVLRCNGTFTGGERYSAECVIERPNLAPLPVTMSLSRR